MSLHCHLMNNNNLHSFAELQGLSSVSHLIHVVEVTDRLIQVEQLP